MVIKRTFLKKLSPTIGFIMENLHSFKWLIFGLFITSTYAAIDLTIKPYIVKLMINNIPNVRDPILFDLLFHLAILYIIASFFMVLNQRAYNYIWMRLNCGLKKRLGLEILKLQMEKSKSFFEDKFPGNLASKTKDVMSGIPDIINVIVDKFYSYTLSIIIAAVVLWATSPRFAFALIIWITLYFGVSIFFSSKGILYCNNAAENRSKAIGAIVDIISNISVVRLFNRKNEEYRKFSSYLDDYVTTDRRRDIFFISIFSYQGLSFVVYQGFCLFWLLTDLRDNHITNGDFALVLLINTSIVNSLISISWEINRFSTIISDVYQGLRIFLIPPTITNKSNAIILSNHSNELTKTTLKVKNISFAYPNNPCLFKNLSLTILPQQKVGIVGYSGSGKSTFINLILREYDVQQGEICIGTSDIRDVTQESLRESIGLIPQEPVFFHRSLKENIAYGKPTATEEEIICAAKKAHAHEFITQLPLGYKSIMGDRGIKLSGGQRQRIAIARAILKNAPILILDEATSQMDSVTESYIQKELFQIMNKKTTIVIAHRLSTLLKLDRILIFSQGKIVGDGTHEELLHNNEHYKLLWNKQINGFLPMLQDTKQILKYKEKAF